MTNKQTVDVCAICGVCPIIYVNPPTIDGLPVCDTCARANISNVMSDIPVTDCRNCVSRECDTIEMCDYCNNRATQICPVCDAMVCNNHIEHDALIMSMTQIMIKCDEPNLMIARHCNRITIAITHDDTIKPVRILRQIVNTICRHGIDRIVTHVTIVIAPWTPYTVTPVTLSQTVWHINAQSVPQITMALNTIGARINAQT